MRIQEHLGETWCIGIAPPRGSRAQPFPRSLAGLSINEAGDIVRFSVSPPANLLEELDRRVTSRGYALRFPAQATDSSAPKDKNEITFTYTLGDAVPLWDEFNPALIRLTVSLDANAPARNFRDERTVNFGMRKFVRDGQRLTVNGRTVFLRGRLDCANYPLTGYAPMDKAEWLRLLKIAKSYGLNHCRFHSWFPPEAALEAADELGMYLAPDLPNKSGRFGSLKEREPGERYNVDFLEVESTSPHTPLAKYLLREAY